jgi:hypothetical protein
LATLAPERVAFLEELSKDAAEEKAAAPQPLDPYFRGERGAPIEPKK